MPGRRRLVTGVQCGGIAPLPASQFEAHTIDSPSLEIARLLNQIVDRELLPYADVRYVP